MPAARAISVFKPRQSGAYLQPPGANAAFGTTGRIERHTFSTMTAPEQRSEALHDALDNRILVIDGAMGTMLQQRQLTPADFGGPALEGCNENLVKTRPDVVLAIHRAYLEAGADIVETNSFNGTKSDLVDYGVDGEAYELMAAAARLARQVAQEFSTPGKPRFVAGSMGPTRKSITISRTIAFDHLQQDYYDLAQPLVDGGADMLL